MGHGRAGAGHPVIPPDAEHLARDPVAQLEQAFFVHEPTPLLG
jgi:hypothetical protein